MRAIRSATAARSSGGNRRMSTMSVGLNAQMNAWIQGTATHQRADHRHDVERHEEEHRRREDLEELLLHLLDHAAHHSARAFSFIAASSFLMSAGVSCGRSTLIVSLFSLAVSGKGGL